MLRVKTGAAIHDNRFLHDSQHQSNSKCRPCWNINNEQSPSCARLFAFCLSHPPVFLLFQPLPTQTTMRFAKITAALLGWLLVTPAAVSAVRVPSLQDFCEVGRRPGSKCAYFHYVSGNLIFLCSLSSSFQDCACVMGACLLMARDRSPVCAHLMTERGRLNPRFKRDRRSHILTMNLPQAGTRLA